MSNLRFLEALVRMSLPEYASFGSGRSVTSRNMFGWDVATPHDSWQIVICCVGTDIIKYQDNKIRAEIDTVDIGKPEAHLLVVYQAHSASLDANIVTGCFNKQNIDMDKSRLPHWNMMMDAYGIGYFYFDFLLSSYNAVILWPGAIGRLTRFYPCLCCTLM